MHRATPSTSSSSAVPQKSRRQYTREQLLKSLEILGPVSTPLPPSLPSPPPSRSSSPVPSLKRKVPSYVDDSLNKRPRTGLAPEDSRRMTSSHSHPPPPRTSTSTHNMRSDPSEEGELREDSSAYRDPLFSASGYVPIRRPRRGDIPAVSPEHLHDKYHNMGRTLKYSSDIRAASTLPQSSPQYKPLAHPPPIGSPYHKYGSMISKLECAEALLCFTYAIWAKDTVARQFSSGQWESLMPFLDFCHGQWKMHVSDERERAILGFIEMLTAFIHGRKVWSYAHRVQTLNTALWQKLEDQYNAEWTQKEAKRTAEPFVNSAGTPPMLPSPASITSNSANSTPSNRPMGASSADDKSNNPTPAAQSSSGNPIPPLIKTLPPHLSVQVDSPSLFRLKQLMGAMADSTKQIDNSERSLTLPVMAKHYPRTFARMIYSTYGPDDEMEPDFDDDEGELYWPGQLLNGRGIGLGWVCYMGRAMIKELGRNYGYLGISGVIPKPGTESTKSGERSAATSSTDGPQWSTPRSERPSGTGRVR